MQLLMGEMRSAMEKYEMIEQGDKIAVGVSGGKDSLVLLKALHHISKYYPINFEVVAMTIDPCFGGIETDYSAIERMCEEMGVEYIIRRTNLGKIIFDDRKEKNPCSLCARMRRGILHDMCNENGCNKIALGHHFDDAVQTFFMNLFQGGNLACYSPKSYLSRKDIWLIRPMSFCEEKDVIKVARKYNLPIVKSKCLADGNTTREKTKLFIKDLESEYPDIRAKVFGAMQRAGISGW